MMRRMAATTASGASLPGLRICHDHCLTRRPRRPLNDSTNADLQAEQSENLIHRDFTAQMPNEKFLTDIIEIGCQNRKLYLAAVPDCFDGSIQGSHMDGCTKTELRKQALENACLNNRWHVSGTQLLKLHLYVKTSVFSRSHTDFSHHMPVRCTVLLTFRAVLKMLWTLRSWRK